MASACASARMASTTCAGGGRRGGGRGGAPARARFCWSTSFTGGHNVLERQKSSRTLSPT